VLTAVCQGDEVLAGAGADVAVQLQVEVAQAGVQPHVAAKQFVGGKKVKKGAVKVSSQVHQVAQAGVCSRL
jgi:hypothetical protein